MIALLVALSLATPASHGHRSAHAHRHKHKPVHVRVDRCVSDAQQVQALERRIGGGGIPRAELSKLENQLQSAIERAQHDCA
jgi:hypothetical protein